MKNDKTDSNSSNVVNLFQKKDEKITETKNNHKEDVITLLPVESAITHSACMLPGGITEANLNHIKVPGIEMGWWVGEGLVVKVRGSKPSLVPSASCKIVKFRENFIF